MAAIRIYPHRTAMQASVESIWWLDSNGERIPCPDVLEGWDYASPLRLGVVLRAAEQELLELTGIAVHEMLAVLVAESKNTGRRFVGTSSLWVGKESVNAEVEVDIPPGVVADRLALSSHLVLGKARSSRSDRSAVAPGARLYQSEPKSLLLEGEAGRFPVESIAFSARGLPAAPWTVVLSHQSMADSFMGSVRLLINSEHPVGQALMNPERASRWGPVVNADAVRLLVSQLSHESEELGEADESSIAAVMDNMCQTLLGSSFEEASAEYVSDPVAFERLIHDRLDPLGRMSL